MLAKRSKKGRDGLLSFSHLLKSQSKMSTLQQRKCLPAHLKVTPSRVTKSFIINYQLIDEDMVREF